MIKLSSSDRLKIYTRYIGHKVVLIAKDDYLDKETGIITGVKASSIQLNIDRQSRWIPVYDDFELYRIILILKPLRMLTDSIKQAANDLPVQNFITQYYIQLGFDMPMFFSPDHPANCRYVNELGLAVYDIEELCNQVELSRV